MGRSRCVLEYIWLDANGNFRSKTKVVYDMFHYTGECPYMNSIPIWNYDGSSTGQANDENTEIMLHPVYCCKSPFFKDDVRERTNCDYFLVLCEIWQDYQPHPDNKRPEALNIFKKYLSEKPWYGFEQEYFVMDSETNMPYDISSESNQNTQQYYCSIGSRNNTFRDLVEEHMNACIYAGLSISGTNAEVAISQFEYQIGPVEGIEACDQLLISRYILERLSENYENCYISYDPKPMGRWNGSGCHTNFSTQAMREKGGYDLMVSVMPKLEKNHLEHMKVYGKHNDKRLLGIHETSSFDNFSWGVGTRHTSIRIGNDCKRNNEGYFEDRRPSANMNPYQVASILLKTVCE